MYIYVYIYIYIFKYIYIHIYIYVYACIGGSPLGSRSHLDLGDGQKQVSRICDPSAM
jgi:hypothetical protein